MAALRATRTPDGAPAARGGPPAAVRYATSPMWPGVFTGHDARCQCTWATWQGTYQVKLLNDGCPVPEHRRSGD